MQSRCEKMEQEKKEKKRGREEEEGENEIVGSSFENNNNAKKRGVGTSFMKDKEKVEEEEEEGEGSWDSSNLAFGVFDFPWLKDGVVSKPEDLEGFEDNFMSSLENNDTSSFKGSGGIDFFDEYGLCDTPEASNMAHIPEPKLVVEDLLQPFDESNGLELQAGDVDNCNWTSLFNQPI